MAADPEEQGALIGMIHLMSTEAVDIEGIIAFIDEDESFRDTEEAIVMRKALNGLAQFRDNGHIFGEMGEAIIKDQISRN